MKNLFFVFGLTVMLLFTFCKENSTAQKIQIIAPEEVYKVMNNGGDLQLIDVRTKEEFTEAHLKTAQNICVTDDDFKEKVAHLDKNEPVYLYCRSGRRSANAAKIMKEMGFKEIYDMDGGILKWSNQGLPKKE